MVGSKYFQNAVLFSVYGLIAKSVSVKEHLEQISFYTRHFFYIKTTRTLHSPADRLFSDSSEVTSDKCVQASIYETKYNVIKVCTDLSQLISDHALSIAILNSKNRPNLPISVFFNLQSPQWNRSVTILK